MKIKSLLLTGLLLIKSNIQSSPGDLDTTFGTGGKVTTAIGSSNDTAESVVIQDDGKIVVAGHYDNGSNNDLVIARYKPNGILDASFGTDGTGIVKTAVGSSDDYGFYAALQRDGKIVVAGASSNGSNQDFAVVRYNTNGTLDASFNSTGKVTTAIGPATDWAQSVAIQKDGKIVVAGYSYNGSDNDIAVVRYNTNGSLDTSFGPSETGIVTTAVGSGNDSGVSVAINKDGKIVVAGNTYNGSNTDFVVVQYNSNGSLDTSFGTGGKVTKAIGSSYDLVYEITIQTDCKILVLGVGLLTNTDVAILRYNTDGSLDTSFGTSGMVTTDLGTSDNYGHSIKIQQNNKFVVGGYSNNGSNIDFTVTRYNSNGSIDTSFGASGTATTDFSSGNDNCYGIAIQGDGKIVAVGYANNGSNKDFALVRYIGDIPEIVRQSAIAKELIFKYESCS